jgi:hypothetical protein
MLASDEVPASMSLVSGPQPAQPRQMSMLLPPAPPSP